MEVGDRSEVLRSLIVKPCPPRSKLFIPHLTICYDQTRTDSVAGTRKYLSWREHLAANH